MSATHKVAALLLVALPAICMGVSELKSGEFSPPGMVPDFRPERANGKKIKLSDYRGKVVACYLAPPPAGVCPTTLAEPASSKEKPGSGSRDFQVA